MSIRSKASRLAQLPPPILTVYLDVNPGTPRNQGTPRGYIRWFKSAAKRLADQLPRSARKPFRAEVRRVAAYLQSIRPHSRGLVLFAGPPIWEAIVLQVEVADELHWGKPSLQQMAWVLDEHRLRGAVLVDGTGARFYRFWLGTVTEDPALIFSLDVSTWRKPELVGPSSPGVSKRRGVQRDILADRIAEQRRRFLNRLPYRIADWREEADISSILLIGSSDEVTAIVDGMPSEVRTHVATLPKVLPGISPSELNQKLRPILNQWEREYEIVLVDALFSSQAVHGSVLGLERTLSELQKGQVRELVTIRGLTGSVQQCINCGWVDQSNDRFCTICGSKRQARSLRTIIPELASLQSVATEVVAGKAASKLATAGGVGAWLRRARIPSFPQINASILSRTG